MPLFEKYLLNPQAIYLQSIHMYQYTLHPITESDLTKCALVTHNYLRIVSHLKTTEVTYKKIILVRMQV